MKKLLKDLFMGALIGFSLWSGYQVFVKAPKVMEQKDAQMEALRVERNTFHTKAQFNRKLASDYLKNAAALQSQLEAAEAEAAAEYPSHAERILTCAEHKVASATHRFDRWWNQRPTWTGVEWHQASGSEIKQARPSYDAYVGRMNALRSSLSECGTSQPNTIYVSGP